MTIVLLFVLLAVTVATGVLLWQQRGQLQRQQQKIDELAVLSFLPDRVQALAREVEACDVSALMKEMEALHHGLDRLEDGLAAPPPAVQGDVPRPQAVRALVARYLRDEGYHAVVIENQDQELQSARLDVRMRATREGAQWRGQVTVDGDEVVDLRLEAAFSAFP